MEKPLSKKDRMRFEELIERAKKAAEKGAQAQLEMGLVMLEIRDERLYREEYDTFEELCQDVWGYGRRYANQLIDFNVIRGQLKDQGVSILPQNESQVRWLKRLPTPKDRAEAWESAIEMGAIAPKPGAPPPQSIVKRAVEAKLHDLEPPAAHKQPAPQSSVQQPRSPDFAERPAPSIPDDGVPSPGERAQAVDVHQQVYSEPAAALSKSEVLFILDHVKCPVCHSIYKLLEEYMTTAEEAPQNSRPNGKEQNFIRGQLEQYFSKISNIPLPIPKTEKQKGQVRARWWTPLREIAEIAHWDQQEGERLIAEAFNHLREKGFLIEAPQSILKTVRALAAGQEPSNQSGRKKSGYELVKEMLQDGK